MDEHANNDCNNFLDNNYGNNSLSSDQLAEVIEKKYQEVQEMPFIKHDEL